ncbi:MAG: hypothetical protein A2010_04100 [Nitrospirae bacterium GWD2_57_9]|nr:MAG: hypothetical protein A2010_04100 [Nitrospirae bacterium GWD2_57_9]OGW50197.1 MAG: hypothetical protein A2078_16135 [Nitrospirae bacterium GWC2_57_9]
MKLYSGKRLGQSRQELTTAIFFSFFFHVVFSIAALLFYTVTPRTFNPPLYAVKLISLPPDQTSGPQSQPRPAPEPEVKPAAKQKQKKAVPRARRSEKKSSIPELAASKQKKQPDQPKTAVDVPAEPAAQGAAKVENVAIATTQQDFKFGWYLELIRDKIGQHWNPPPDASEAKVRVVFSINRSGWVGEVNLDADQSSGTFGFKQAGVRAVRASNPFPPLPEDFSKQTLEFTADLMAVD